MLATRPSARLEPRVDAALVARHRRKFARPAGARRPCPFARPLARRPLLPRVSGRAASVPFRFVRWRAAWRKFPGYRCAASARIHPPAWRPCQFAPGARGPRALSPALGRAATTARIHPPTGARRRRESTLTLADLEGCSPRTPKAAREPVLARLPHGPTLGGFPRCSRRFTGVAPSVFTGLLPAPRPGFTGLLPAPRPVASRRHRWPHHGATACPARRHRGADVGRIGAVLVDALRGVVASGPGLDAADTLTHASWCTLGTHVRGEHPGRPDVGHVDAPRGACSGPPRASRRAGHGATLTRASW
jgi:hypothetical protein